VGQLRPAWACGSYSVLLSTPHRLLRHNIINFIEIHIANITRILSKKITSALLKHERLHTAPIPIDVGLRELIPCSSHLLQRNINSIDINAASITTILSRRRINITEARKAPRSTQWHTSHHLHHQ
jgi:hypothetical protein